MAKSSISPLSESDIRWLKAERELLARELAALDEKQSHVIKRLDAMDTRLIAVEKAQAPSATPKAASSTPQPQTVLADVWALLRSAAAPYLWRLAIGAGALLVFRVASGQWPRQEQLLAILQKMF